MIKLFIIRANVIMFITFTILMFIIDICSFFQNYRNVFGELFNQNQNNIFNNVSKSFLVNFRDKVHLCERIS